MTKVEKENLKVIINIMANDFNFYSKKAVQHREEGNIENARYCSYQSEYCIQYLNYFRYSNFINFTIKNDKYEQVEIEFLF